MIPGPGGHKAPEEAPRHDVPDKQAGGQPGAGSGPGSGSSAAPPLGLRTAPVLQLVDQLVNAGPERGGGAGRRRRQRCGCKEGSRSGCIEYVLMLLH